MFGVKKEGITIRLVIPIPVILLREKQILSESPDLFHLLRYKYW